MLTTTERPRTLSRDIRLLGDTLGETLSAHGGAALLADVEAMRHAAKRAREAPAESARAAAREELAAIAARLDAARAVDVVRAFTLYFQLVNLAEDTERSRVLRAREARGIESVAESIAAAVAELQAGGATLEEVLAALCDLRVCFVFTAHPTEARRRTTERLLSLCREALTDLDRRRLTEAEQRGTVRRLRAGIEALWEHADQRDAPPDVVEEAKAGLWYLRNVLLDVVPKLSRRLVRAIEASYGPVDPMSLPVPVRFGTWMGSDRDGNPHVTDDVTAQVLGFHRHIAIERYLADLSGLVDLLGADARRLPPSPTLDAAIARCEKAVPQLVEAARARNPHEPLRRLLTLMHARLDRARRFEPGAYASADELLDDLLAIRQTLEAAHATALPDDLLLDMVNRVRCFGLSLAAMDVREDARVHRAVVAELLGEPGYPDWDDARRRAALDSLALPSDRSALSPEARRLLSLFSHLAAFQTRFGAGAIGTYAISMCEHVADVLEIVRLAELHGLEDTLDVVPLFETRAALERAGPLLGEMLDDAAYRAHVARRGDLQELLLGYSDSMKEAGILGSRVEVHGAQVAAARACRTRGVTLRVFHGRGGSVSRGGGPTHRAIRALPREAMSGDVKITEQGETRAFHFADPDLALRYLERTIGAALVVRHEARALEGGAPPAAPDVSTDAATDADLLRRLADESRVAYRALVDAPGFLTYFREATPLDQIAALNIASRPSRRGRVSGLSDLRAIPWVFAWSQSRQLITGWYGVGTALAAVADEEGGPDALAALYRSSPFFQDLLDNVHMSLAKADMPIAGRYAARCKDADVRLRIFGAIQAEHARTVEEVLRVTGQSELLGEDPVLQTSIRLRNPYVDPLSYLQVEALARLDAGDAAWSEVARGSIRGVAAGLRNTG